MTERSQLQLRMATLGDVLSVAQGDASARDFALALGRICFLDLKPIRLVLGHKRWLSKRAIVHAVTKSCIRQASNHNDVCVQLGDEQYTLIFSDDDIERMASTCKQIVDTIEMKLFGQKDLGRVLIRDAANVFADGAVRKDDPDDAQPDEAGVAQAFEAEESEPDAQPRPGSNFSSGTRQTRRARLMQVLQEEPEEPLQYGYMPIWDAREGRIVTYFCQPYRGQDDYVVRGHAVLGKSPDASSILQLDTHAIEECVFELSRMSADTRVHLMTSVHFETLANRASRTELCSLLSVIPQRYCRSLTLHLCEVPTGIPEARLSEITTHLSHWVRNIAVTIRMSECPTLKNLGMRTWQFGRANIGVVGVEFDMPEVDECVRWAKQLSRVLGPRGLRLAAMNVPTADALCELSINDYSYLSGNAIGGFLPRPGPPREFTMRDLERASHSPTHARAQRAVG